MKDVPIPAADVDATLRTLTNGVKLMYTNDTLKDRVALITGGGTELGLEI